MDAGKKKRRAAEVRRSATLMRRVLLAMKARLDDELREKNVTTAQLRFLTEVKERPGSSGAQVARACYVTPQSAQAMMARAVKHGWVVRGKDAENDRLVTARLSEEGERLLVHADKLLAGLEARMWEGVSGSKLREMREVLERGLDNLERERVEG